MIAIIQIRELACLRQTSGYSLIVMNLSLGLDAQPRLLSAQTPAAELIVASRTV